MRTYAVYIVASESGVLYIGVTNDLDRRVFEHRNKLVPGFSARCNVRKLVYFELFGDAPSAIAREKELKGWLRRRKIALIESANPKWRDLARKRQTIWPGQEEMVISNVGGAAKDGQSVRLRHSERSEESLRSSFRKRDLE